MESLVAATEDVGKGHRYEFPTERQWKEETADILKNFAQFLDLNGYSIDDDIVIRNRDLTDIALRVHKRAAYYAYFHGISISERKRAALQAYWINQFHPFIIEEERWANTEFACLINEHFAAYLLLVSVYGNEDTEPTPNGSSAGPELYEEIKASDYYEKLIYSIRYRNIPIDSFIILAETIVPDTFKQTFNETR